MEDHRKVLTVWYNHSKRELPWRESQDPYKIWISEVILQQTRVKQGLDYYQRFLHSFPDINSLAAAPEEEVLKVWQGLGYYSRARNLHHAAKTIVKEFNGIFPRDYSSIRKLKGIGDYTAAAIASIAFRLPYAVVDGNVFRVLARLFGISIPIDSTKGKKEFYNLAQEMLDVSQPGEFNQAIMEFGAVQCLPGNPDCINCPLNDLCFACLNGSVNNFPVKSKQKKQSERYLNFIYLHDEDYVCLERREDVDIWKNMYQFPLIECSYPAAPEEVIGSKDWERKLTGIQYQLENITPERIHLLTHQRLHIRFFIVRFAERKFSSPLMGVGKTQVTDYPVPKPIESFLLEMGH
jgi:A/G-specific adenine glycosylase